MGVIVFSDREKKKRGAGRKRISTIFIILVLISLIYAANSKNQTFLIVSASILATYMLMETLWTIKDHEYKTTYWIALANLINIACNISLIVLFYKDKNIADIEQIMKYVLTRDKLLFVFYLSLVARSLLSLNIFKINKILPGCESRDV